MALILALETTTNVCSVAVGTGKDYVTESIYAPRQHNKILLSKIDQACTSFGIDRKQLDCVAFSAGPGTFTGVRIAAAVAQGVSLATHAKVCCVPTSLVIGNHICDVYKPQGVFDLIRLSRRNLVYLSKLQSEDGKCQLVSPDQLVEKETLDASNTTFSGDDINACAIDVLNLALQNMDSWQVPEKAQPIYVDGDHPWQPSS